MTIRRTEDGHEPGSSIPASGVAVVVWRRLKEMKTVFYLLLVLAAGGLAAVVLPQQQPAEYYQERYGPFLSDIILRLGLDHVSTATWFLLLLAVLMLSLVACTRNLWTIARSRWRIPGADEVLRAADGGPGASPVNLPVSAEVAVGAVKDAARGVGYRLWSVTVADGARCLYLCRHRFSAWGTTLAHYAVFAIGLGALLGSLPGLSVDEYLELSEGRTSAAQELPAMPFQLRLNDFRAEVNSETGAVVNYFSDISVIADGHEVHRQTISVNRPLRYRGFYISQASWGLAEARLRLRSETGEETLSFPLARTAATDPHASAWGVPEERAIALLARGDAAVLVRAFYIDARREGEEVVGRNSEALGTPAIRLLIVSGLPARASGGGQATETGAWLPAAPSVDFRLTGYTPQLAQRASPRSGRASGPPAPGPARTPHEITDVGFLLLGETKKTPVGEISFVAVTQSSGLGIRRDPGVPLVWIGFVGCLAGMALIFYFPLRRVYISLVPTGEGEAACELRLQVQGGSPSDSAREAQRLQTSIETAVAVRRPRGNGP